MIDNYICNGCCNKEECSYYKDIINKYQESPLHIKIDDCDNYESTFNKMIENIKSVELSEDVIHWLDTDDCKEAFSGSLRKLLKYNMEE